MTTRITSILACGILVVMGTMAVAQESDKPEEQVSAEQQMLQDFGAGLKAVGWAMEDSDVDLRETYEAATDALFPDKSDEGMAIYLDDYEANQQREELETFGGDLKNAVMNGSMTREEAWSTWMVVMDEGGKGEDDQEGDWAGRLENAARNGSMSSIHLRIPDGGDVRVLTRPEFLRRDLQYFGRELQLEESTRAIIEVLLEDYVSTYEKRTEELRAAILEARARAGRQWRIRKVDNARSMFNDLSSSVDWDQVRRRVSERVGNAEKQQWMINAAQRFTETLPSIQQAIERRHATLDRTMESSPRGPNVLQLAANLQADRLRMRTDLIESMRLVLNERQREILEGIFDQFILQQGREDSRLGGSRINLEAALAESLGDQPMDETSRTSLEGTKKELGPLVDQWTNARIDRERSGLEMFVAYEQNGEAGAERLARGHAQRATSELNAAIAIRDRLLAGQSELQGSLAEADPETARRFMTVTRQQGFAPQMRTRWSERALTSAMSCTDLDDERRETLIEYESEVSTRLQPIRMEAIQTRMTVEPKIARAKIRELTDDSGETVGLVGWREPGVVKFNTLDEQVSDQLEALLQGLACGESLPRRRGVIDGKALEDAKSKEGDGKGSGKGSGKGGAGKGTASGAGASGKGGAGKGGNRNRTNENL
jgi:hypothetical protein